MLHSNDLWRISKKFKIILRVGCSFPLESSDSFFIASRRTKILCWVSPEPYTQHHQQARKDVLLGTGNWLLSDPVFDKWKKESVSSILWLHGIPGSGKSKLA